MSVNQLTLSLEHHARLLISVAITGCVLVASAYLAPRISFDRVLLVSGAILALIGLFGAWRWPALGLIGLIIASLIIPFKISTGTDSAINVAILGVIGTFALWIADVVIRPDARPRRSRLYLSLLTFAGIAALAFAFGYRPEIPFAETAPIRAQLGGLAIFWLSPVAFIVTGHQIRNTRWLAGLTWTFVALGGAFVLARQAHVTFVTDTLFQPGVTSGSLFYLWLVVLSFGQATFNRTLPLLVRLGCATIILSTLYFGFFHQRDWSSGWVPPLVAIVVATCVARPRLGIAVTLACLALLAVKASDVSALLLTDYKQYDILTRQAAWTALIPLVKASPILGLGPANYYWYTPLFPILGWNVQFNSHEQYLDLLLQTGFLGLSCFTWAMLEIGVLGIQLRNRVSSGFEQAYVCAAVGGLAGSLVAGLLGDWFLPFVYNIGFDGFRSSVLGWIFLGGLLALERQRRRALVSITGGKDAATTE